LRFVRPASGTLCAKKGGSPPSPAGFLMVGCVVRLEDRLEDDDQTDDR
jgi:hypothetical protein